MPLKGGSISRLSCCAWCISQLIVWRDKASTLTIFRISILHVTAVLLQLLYPFLLLLWNYHSFVSNRHKICMETHSNNPVAALMQDFSYGPWGFGGTWGSGVRGPGLLPCHCTVWPCLSCLKSQPVVDKFSVCLVDISVQLSAIWLQLNASKTQPMWLGSTQLLDSTCQDMLVLGMRVTLNKARDLIVVTDCELSPAMHVLSVCWSSYNHLCQLRPVVRPLPMHAQAFISCCLDYCNSLLYDDGLLCHVQLVQNMAVLLVTGTPFKSQPMQ